MTVKIGGPLTESEVAEAQQILIEYQPSTPRQIAQLFSRMAQEEDPQLSAPLYPISSLMFRYATEFPVAVETQAAPSRHARPMEDIPKVI